MAVCVDRLKSVGLAGLSVDNSCRPFSVFRFLLYCVGLLPGAQMV
jgi:hypothetical protein